jgi:MarR family transcriptional regulator, lower aerobic nicotinate degradation pathway regulator
MQPRRSGTSARAADSEVRTTLDALRRIVRELRRPETGGRGRLTASQLYVLHALAGPGPISINELADRTYTHQSTVSVVAKTLAARGLLARSRSRSDARRVELTLTAAGRNALRRFPRAPQELLIDGLGRMSPASRKRLASSLTQLLLAMGISGGSVPMFFTEERTKSPRTRRPAAARRRPAPPRAARRS